MLLLLLLLLLLCPLLIKVVVYLSLLVRVLCDALHLRNVLTRCCWWAHVEAVVSHGQVGIHVLYRVHFSAAHILGCNGPRFVHEGYLIVYALGYYVCISLACGVEEVEFLAPVALALRLEAVVAGWLGLVAFEMAFSACQTASARPLWLFLGRCIAGSLAGGQRLTSGRVIVGWRCGSTSHGGVLLLHTARPEIGRCAVGCAGQWATTTLWQGVRRGKCVDPSSSVFDMASGGVGAGARKVAWPRAAGCEAAV